MLILPITQKDTGRARTRGNLGIKLSDKVARGRAGRITAMITVVGPRAHIAILRLKIKICELCLFEIHFLQNFIFSNHRVISERIYVKCSNTTGSNPLVRCHGSGLENSKIFRIHNYHNLLHPYGAKNP